MGRPPFHRGPGPEDDRLFDAGTIPTLRAAAGDLCWLLDHGYASHSAGELVGNRHDLASRQRMAVSRCACSRAAVENRRARQVSPEAIRDQELWLDGYNVLTILESALARGLVLLGRDGCYRDIAGIHRRYRRVNETVPGLRLIGETADRWGVTCCRWWLDKPVSNSGRLKTLIHDQAKAAGWKMDVELDFNPDRVLFESPHIVATSDGAVLDRCRHWVNLAGHIISENIPNAWVLDLRPTELGNQ